jgi:hypothetical protein
MDTKTAPLSQQDFAAAYQQLRTWVMKTYGVTTSQIDERAAISLRNISMIVRRGTFLGYSLELAPEAPIDDLREYLRALPHYSFRRSPSGQVEEAMREHAAKVSAASIAGGSP